MTPRRVVVVGGSIAASTAVQTLRTEGFDGDITVLSDEEVGPYTRVPLSKDVLAGRADLAETALDPPDDDVDLRLSTRALGLDRASRVVHTSTGPVPYDGLVVATGARARRLGTPDQRELVLRDRGDATVLRRHLSGARDVLVVGGGFLGMEIASTCRTLGLDVTVVDLAPPLERLLGPVVAAHVRSAAEAAGVRVVVAPGGVELVGAPRPTGVRTADGLLIEADAVVSAVGDVPNVDWLAGSDLRVVGGLVVDERCRAADDVVAAGDVAVVSTDGVLVRTPSWTNAVEQARCATLSLLHGTDAPPFRPSRYFWTEQFGLDLKLVGALNPADHPVALEGELGRGPTLLAWPDAQAPTTVLAVDHHVPPAKLKRMLRRAPATATV